MIVVFQYDLLVTPQLGFGVSGSLHASAQDPCSELTDLEFKFNIAFRAPCFRVSSSVQGGGWDALATFRVRVLRL